MIRVLVADDHGLVRAGLCELLRQLPGVEVVAEAANGREALALVAKHRPHVVLMDLAMPELNGLDATARVRKEFPQTRVIALSMHTGEEYVLQALRAGASGYLLKGATPVELEMAVTAVARGETYLSPAISKHVIDDYVRRSGAGAEPHASLTRVSERSSSSWLKAGPPRRSPRGSDSAPRPWKLIGRN